MVATLLVTRSTSLFNDVDGDGSYDPGDTLFHTIVVTNQSGVENALNVVINDDVLGATPTGTINISPIAFNDSFTAVGNTTLLVGGATNPYSGPATSVAGNLLSNDVDFLGDSFQIDVVVGGVSAGGGTFNINADGSFSYINDAGDTGVDTFTYTIRDDGFDGIYGNADDLISTGTVSITLTGEVWYVDAVSGSDATGDGTSANPFATLTHLNNAATDVDGAGDTIYVQGNVAGSITLEASQKLIGTGEDLIVDGFTIAADTGSNSAVNATSGFGVTLGTDNTIAGVNLGGTGGITGTGFGTLTVTDDVVLNNSGQALNLTNGTFAGTGFAATSSSGGTANVSLTDVSGSVNLGTTGALSGATGNAINVSNTGGAALNTSVTYGGSVTHAGTGALLNVDGGTAGHSGTITLTGAKSATAGTGLNFENADGTYSITGTTTLNGGNAGIDIVSNANGNAAQGSAGSFTFGGVFTITSPTGTAINIADSTANVNADIDVTQANNASALNVTNHSGGTLTFQTTGSFNVTGGNGLQFTNADGIYQVHSANTLGGVDGGIDILGDSGGTFTFLVNTAINNTGAGAAFNLDNSDANVTFNGSITDSNGRAVSINEHDAGTISFSTQSAITATGGTGNGIHITNSNGGSVAFNGQVQLTTGANNAVTLTSNGGSTVTFNADDLGLDISTTTGQGFNATGGGTVTVLGTGNTIASVGGTALNIANTDIGSGGLNFFSISANGGTNGIVLNTTGTAGGLNVTGNGAGSNNFTGGTIQNTTGDGILLNSTENVRLGYMNITDNGGDGIGGTNVHGLVINRSTFNSNGDDPASDESGINIVGLTGTASNGARPTSITNSVFTNNYEFEVQISNSVGTLSNFQFLNNTVTSNGADTGGNLVNFLGLGTAVMGITATGNTFTGNAPATATALHIDTSGTSTHAIIEGNTFTNNNVGVNVSTGPGSTTLIYRIHDNDFVGTRSNAINEFHNGNTPFNRNVHGTITDNVIGTQGVANSGSSVGAGIRIGNEGAVNTTHLISGNTIQSIGTQGVQGNEAIQVNVGLVGSNTGGGTVNLTIQNNVIRDIMNARAVVIQDNQQLGIGNPGPGPFPTINLSMLGNQFLGTISGQAGNGSYIRLVERSGTFNVRQNEHTAAANPAELDDANGFNNPTLINTSTLIGGSITYGAPAPATPTTPTLAMEVAAPPPVVQATPPATGTGGKTTDGTAGSMNPDTPTQPTDTDTPAGPAGPDAPAAPVNNGPIVVDDGVISQAELDLIVEAAIQRWADAGATPEQIAAMRAVTVSVSDLGGLQLGTSGMGAITIDDNGAGWSWFIDATPGDDSEFGGAGSVLTATSNTSQAGTRVDLLTVMMHELGHQIGLGHETDAGELMFGSIRAGERRLPGADDAEGATGTPITGGLSLDPVGIGTLPAGQSVTVVFTSTIDPVTNQVITPITQTTTVTGDNVTINPVSDNTDTLALDTLTIGNLVFLDVDKNGLFDGSDTGIAGVTLTLFADTDNDGVLSAGDTELGTTTTDANGLYSFTSLAPGEYIVRVDAANFESGGVLEGTVTSLIGDTDPDDDATNGDDNGIAALDGSIATEAVTLDYNTEPTDDGDADADTNLSVDFAFEQPNQAPTIANLQGNTVTWTEGDGVVRLDAMLDAVVGDADSANFDGGTLTVTYTNGLSEDAYTINTAGDVAVDENTSTVSVGGVAIGTFTFDSNGFVFSFNSDATHARVTELVRALGYNNNAGDDPTGGDRTVSMTLVDGDGTANGGDDDVTVTSTITVVAVNDEPAGADLTISLNEDGGTAFDSSSFGFDDSVDGNTMAGIVLTTLPASGDLYLDGVAITAAGTFVTKADLDAVKLTYQPDPNENGTGYASFTFQVRDDGGTANGGVDTDQTPNTVTLDVNAINDAPVNSVPAATQTFSEDGTLTFNAANSNLISISDVDAGIDDVRVTLSIEGGALTLSGTSGLTFTTGDGSADTTMTFSGNLTDINAALNGLVYNPSANFNGDRTLTITTNDLGNTGGDPGLTGDGSSEQDSDTIAITVTSVNDAPAGADLTISLNEDGGTAFDSSSFGFDDSVDGNTMTGIVLTTLPASGDLYLDGVAITAAGTFVTKADLDAVKLTYQPDPNENGTGYASFTFQVRDDGGTTNGGVDTDQTPNTVTLDVNPINDAPVVTIVPPPAGPAGGEVRVNTTTNDDQASPSVAGLSGGGYVVAWASEHQDGGSWGIYSQRYDDSGTALGGETLVNTTVSTTDDAPSVAGLSGGGYVVTWMSTPQDTSGAGIYAQRYDASGVALGGEEQVNTHFLNGQEHPWVAALTGGGYVVTWMSSVQDGDSGGIYAQRFDAVGVPQGGEFRVNSTTAGDQKAVSATGLADGGFVVTWESFGQDGGGWGIFAQRYNAAGVAQGGEVQVNSFTAFNQVNAAVAGLSGGGYIVTWMSHEQDGDFTGVYAQLYDTAGSPVGGEVQVNTTTIDVQRDPAVAALSNGGYVITWQSPDGGLSGIYSREYDASGVAQGGETLVNTTTSDGQSNPSVSGLSDGGYVVAWVSANQDGSVNGVYAQRFAGGFVATEQTAIDLKGTIDITDVDAGAATLTVTLTVDHGILDVTEGGSGAGVTGSGTSTVTITGTLAQIQALLNTDGTSTVTFTSTGDTPPASATLTVTANDGGATGADPGTSGTGSDEEGSSQVVITINPVNDAPIIDLNGAGAGVDNTASYTEQAPIMTLAADLALTDDGATLTGATVQITGGFVPLAGDGADYLGIAGSGGGTISGISYSYSALTGVLTLSGSASVADYQAVLRQVSFQSTTNDPGTSRTISWTVTDGALQSTPVETTITVTPVNDAPVVTLADATVSGTEDEDLVFSAANGNAITVSDKDSATLTVTLSVASGVLTLAQTTGLTVTGDGTGSVEITGSADDINAALEGLVYRGNLNYEGSDTLSVVVDDGALTDSESIAITLADDGTVDGTPGNDTLTGTAFFDFFDLSQGGSDTANGGEELDVFYMGGALDAGDDLDGGAGTDQLALQGDYSGGLTLGANNLINTEVVALLSGTDTRFGEDGINLYDYDLTTVDANVAAGERLFIDAAQLVAGEDLTFDGSAETDGSLWIFAGKGTDDLTGGAQLDVFLFREAGSFTADDRIDGGGGMDQLALRGDYSGQIEMQADTITNVEVIALLSGNNTHYGPIAGDFSYNLKMHDGNVLAGQTLFVDGAQLGSEEELYFDGSAETDGAFKMWGGAGNDVLTGGAGDDIITGGGRGDTLTGGGGNDIFRYNVETDSNSTERDGIQDFTLGDRIDLSLIDADALTGGNQAFTFVGAAAFSGTAGELRYENISLGGPIWLIQGDTNGDGVSDVEIVLVTPDNDPITAIDFIF